MRRDSQHTEAQRDHQPAGVPVAVASYSAGEGTRVLLADGTHRGIADLRVGDDIYGTSRVGWTRRFARTSVLGRWSVSRPAHRVTLADGTEFVASSDQRFLTWRGWKHVTGAEQGRDRRPHLTVGAKLLGVGRLAELPSHDADYRAGYLCGMVRGDGYLATSTYERRNGRVETLHRFRLALADAEALRRTQAFLDLIEVPTRERIFSAATTSRRAITAIATNTLDGVERVREVIRWPHSPSDGWRKGFLAGIFDAEGSGGQVLRICNTDPEIIDWTTACLAHFGFDFVIEPPTPDHVASYVRVRGGLVERLRFFHMTGPAITRKQELDGRAVRANADLRVVSIKPLGKAMQMYVISTATGDVIANGVVIQTVGPPVEAKNEPDQRVAAGLSAQARPASSG
jgi:hypothetical protein